MKSYFVTLGFNETFLLRLLSETSARREDSLHVLVPSPVSSGTRAALDNLRVQAERLYGLTPTLSEIDLQGSFPELLNRIMDVVLPLRDPIITDLTLGMRMIDSLILLSLLVSGKEFRAYVRDEGGGSKVVSFQRGEINSLLREYSVEEVKLLREVSKELEIHVIALNLGKSEKTIQNKVSELKKLGLVTVVGKGRTTKLTPLGECVLKVIDSKLGSLDRTRLGENKDLEFP